MKTRLVLAGRTSASYKNSSVNSKDEYHQFLQKAKAYTLKHPEGQLHGRRGRRCVLEDGERLLLLCLDLRPSCIEARMLLMQNLITQNRGREDEVPSLAIETLKQTSLRDCRKSASHADDAMIVVKVTGATSLLAAANYFDFHDT
ncbi:hypothetical protein WJX75_006412 [Coccomyxa subellipsoidea]|uniref:Uncharacterized protein n=1 Tax=Coccomyxa subellipsoidea TaxID=248742 RepID=A0ABR2Z442_9CHLO